jgi:DeoR/GlpR family transcriptional regulator of sugar metabolism
MAESNIRSLRFDTAVVTPCALNLRDGLLAHDLDDAAVKRAGLESAARVVVACSGTKWNASAVALVAALDAVDVLVTDKQFSPEELVQLTRHSVEVVNV